MTNRVNRWIKRKLKELKVKCEDCGSEENLQFSHIKPTTLRGRSRGRKERYYDYIKNPTHYKIRCKICHDEFDGRESK